MAKAKQQINLNSLEGLESTRQVIPWIQTYLDIYEKMMEANSQMQSHADKFEESGGAEELESFTLRHQQQFIPTAKHLIHCIALIPDFKNLALEDQMILIQNNLMSLHLVISSRTFDPVRKSVRVASMCAGEQLVLMLVLPEIEETFQEYRRTSENIYNLRLDAAESAILWSLTALQTYGSDLIQQATMEAMRENMTSHLHDYSQFKTGGMERAFEILLLLPDIISAGEMGKAHIQSTFRSHPHLVVEPLFRDTLLVNVLRARSPSPVGNT